MELNWNLKTMELHNGIKMELKWNLEAMEMHDGMKMELNWNLQDMELHNEIKMEWNWIRTGIVSNSHNQLEYKWKLFEFCHIASSVCKNPRILKFRNTGVQKCQDSNISVHWCTGM